MATTTSTTSDPVRIMNDTVLKLSIMQGREEQREDAALGVFTSGELAYTRDTGRVFVGDASDGMSTFQLPQEEWPDLQKHLQYTPGGSLTGNKYIGLIDSRPLATAHDATSPLSYTTATGGTNISSGDPKNPELKENGMLTVNSKFRQAHPKAYYDQKEGEEVIDTVWDEFGNPIDNWDRTATYNEKLKAYTGDYFFDIYQNALILVDHRIDPVHNKREEAEYEDAWIPEFVTDTKTGLNVSPQTFKDENNVGSGKTVASNTAAALNQKRRTPVKNYIKVNDNYANPSDIYGDGYIIMRIVEPDNYTLQFKPRQFDTNGLPIDEDGGFNYNHNLLEIRYVPLCTFSMHFNCDFYIPDCKSSPNPPGIELNKEIEGVKSITSGNAGGGLKLPNKIIFSEPFSANNANPCENRGSVGQMQWNFNMPNDIVAGAQYNIKLVPQVNGNALKYVTDDKNSNKKYPVFDVSWEKVTPPKIQDYYINLKGGLRSDQANSSLVRLDENATNASTAPTITFSLEDDDDGPLVDNENDPLGTGQGGYTVYSSNFGISPKGLVKTIDTYEDQYYEIAKDRINLYEEQNTSVNLLKKPITIMSTSKNPELYSKLNGGIYDSTGTLSCAKKDTAATDKVTDNLKNNIKTLLDKITGASQIKVGANTSASALSNYSSTKLSAANTLAIDNTLGANSGGVAVAVSTAAIGQTGVELGKIAVSATISDLTNSSSVNKFTGFLALKNGENLIKVESFEQYYSNFSFTFSFDASEVLVGSGTYVVIGIICDNFNTKFNMKLDRIAYSYRTLNAEQRFEVGRAGINAYLDFCSEPYLYCFRKVVTTPDRNMLPAATSAIPWAGKAGTTYFNSFASNASYVKTWNNMAWVLGHNHYLNNNMTDSTVPIISRNNMAYSGAETVTKKIFKYLRGFEVNPTTYAKIAHTKIDTETAPSIIFSWWAEYKKNGTTKSEIIYYLDERSETRDEADVYDQGEDIDYVYIGAGTKNLITSADSDTQIVKGDEVNYGDGYYGRQYAIMSESTYFDGDISYIRYGRSSQTRKWRYQDEGGNYVYKTITQPSWGAVNDLFKTAGLNYDYELKGFSQYGDGYYEADSVSKIVLHNGSTTGAVTITGTNLTTILNNGINVDSTVANVKVSNYSYMSIFYLDPMDDAPEPFVATYMIINGKYAAGVYEPKSNVGTGAIINSNGALASVTINESIPTASRVYIPKHARTILLEMTHVTSTNNTVGISYSNEFGNLGIMLSGYSSQEYNANPTTFTNELTINPWYDYPNDPDAGYSNSGVLQIPGSKSSKTASAFHSTTAVPTSQVPSAYSTAQNEKMLCLSSQTETKILEVPFQKSNQTGIRHFALRLTNLRPATNESANYFCLKVIGYRV